MGWGANFGEMEQVYGLESKFWWVGASLWVGEQILMRWSKFMSWGANHGEMEQVYGWVSKSWW